MQRPEAAAGGSGDERRLQRNAQPLKIYRKTFSPRSSLNTHVLKKFLNEALGSSKKHDGGGSRRARARRNVRGEALEHDLSRVDEVSRHGGDE